VEYYTTHGEEEREDMFLDFLYERGVEGDMCTFSLHAKTRERFSFSQSSRVRWVIFSLFFHSRHTWGRNIIIIMGKTGTEKPLKAPKKKQKELDEDDLAALARKKEEQAKLNALKKQVAGGAKLGKGMSKSK
jgi:sec-independent protein translocase protein TatA